MTDVGWLSPEDSRKVVATVNRLLASGLLDRGSSGAATMTPGYHYVTNVSGEEIPAYACMQMTGTAESGGQNYIEVDKPADADGSAGGFIFNGPNAIEIGGDGIGLAGPVVRALGDGSVATAGETWGPEASAWTITSGGSLFAIVGDDDVETDVVKVQVKGGAGVSLFRFTLTSGWTDGVASATIRDMDTGATVEESEVRDPEAAFSDGTTGSLISGDKGYCEKQNGNYYIYNAPCGSHA